MPKQTLIAPLMEWTDGAAISVGYSSAVTQRTQRGRPRAAVRPHLLMRLVFVGRRHRIPLRDEIEEMMDQESFNHAERFVARDGKHVSVRSVPT